MDSIRLLIEEEGVLDNGDNDNRSSDLKKRNNFDEHTLSHYCEHLLSD